MRNHSFNGHEYYHGAKDMAIGETNWREESKDLFVWGLSFQILASHFFWKKKYISVFCMCNGDHIKHTIEICLFWKQHTHNEPQTCNYHWRKYFKFVVNHMCVIL